MRVTALIDNTRLDGREDLLIERGLSIHITTMSKQILFDTGNGEAFCKNAALLGINISDIDATVISHRHHDHCNGVSHFLNANTKAQVFFKSCKTADYYFKAYGLTSNIGFDKELINQENNRISFIEKMTEILPNVFIITNISNKYQQPKGNKYLYTQSEKECKPDSFDHELLMIIKETDGIIVFTGCAHNGVLNMVDTAVMLFPDIRIKAVVGGFHLVGLPLFNSIGGTREEIASVGYDLLKYPIDKLYTGHCTGTKAFAILKGVLKDRLEHLPTGRSVII